jgi:glycosyltransferase involved in cell wall biosynthesis
MFQLDIPAVPYADPWRFPLEERIRRAEQRQHRVVYLYDEVDNSTFRYRVYNMIQALDTTPDISATYFTTSELEHLHRVLPRIETLVVVRSRYTNPLNQAILRARGLGIRVLFDIDDMVFDIDYVPLIATTLDQDVAAPFPGGPWDYWFAYCGRLGATLKCCDGAITTNEFLAEQLHRFSGKPVWLIPNYMNREQLEISRHIFEQKRSRGFARTGQIHLGYFSGSPSHNRDLELASGALARLLDARSDVVLRVVGYMELKGELSKYAERIERGSFLDFVNLQRSVGEVEINLMPLQDNLFTNCKSELKYFEAGIVGTLSIASPTFTYRRAIADGSNGYLANNQDWDDKLGQAVELAEDPDRYAQMAERAHDHSERLFAVGRHTPRIAEILLSQAAPAVPDPAGAPLTRPVTRSVA